LTTSHGNKHQKQQHDNKCRTIDDNVDSLLFNNDENAENLLLPPNHSRNMVSVRGDTVKNTGYTGSGPHDTVENTGNTGNLGSGPHDTGTVNQLVQNPYTTINQSVAANNNNNINVAVLPPGKNEFDCCYCYTIYY